MIGPVWVRCSFLVYELRLRVLSHVVINMANGLFPLVHKLREGDVIWTNLLKYVYH